ncbi:transporter [Oscillatoriales cyanobacterium USR001]|nr:transporter [Oscillatoriales cyanobacterium USR001]
MTEQPKENSIQNSNDVSRADTPWIFRFSLVLAATCGVVAIIAVAFKSSSTVKMDVKNDVNSQSAIAPKVIPNLTKKHLPSLPNLTQNQSKPPVNSGIIITNSLPKDPQLKVEQLPIRKDKPPIPNSQKLTNSTTADSKLIGRETALPCPYPLSVMHSTENCDITNSVTQKSPEQLELVAISPTPSPTEKTVEPNSENSPPPTVKPESMQDESGVELTLSEVVFLGLENNREIKNQYLDRIVQKQDLAVAESKFSPSFTPELSVSAIRLRNGGSANINEQAKLSAKVSIKIPTGGDISFSWIGTQTQDSLRQNLQLSFNQPLLRGSGAAVNKASIEIARLAEKRNILNLKSTLIDTITSAILAYRELIKAQEQVKISQSSLEIARRQLEINQVLIQAGRLAKVEIFSGEKAVADQEVTVLATADQLKRARLALLQILDIDRNLNIIAVESSSVEAHALDFKNMIQLAMSNSPNYLQVLLDREIAKYNLLLAEDRRRWNLNVNASYNNNASNSGNGNSDLRAGLVLTREFGNRGIERDFQSSRVSLLKAENNLTERNQQLEIQVTNAIRDISLNLKQVELAKKSRELAEKQLEIEQEKLRLGLGNSRTIDIVNFQNALIQARNTELNAKIDYFNALTNLDKIIGTTLETWQVKIEE